jgi:hypothetical protein
MLLTPSAGRLGNAGSAAPVRRHVPMEQCASKSIYSSYKHDSFFILSPSFISSPQSKPAPKHPNNTGFRIRNVHDVQQVLPGASLLNRFRKTYSFALYLVSEAN